MYFQSGGLNSETLTHLILMIPIFYLRNKGLGHFGYRLAKARLGRQEAWIIVGSANHVGLTAFIEESWHLMVIEVMKMEIYKYIRCWSQVTAVLGTACPEHKTSNRKLLKLCSGNLVNLTMNVDGEITGLSISSFFFPLFGVFTSTSIHSLIFSFFLIWRQASMGWILNL